MNTNRSRLGAVLVLAALPFLGSCLGSESLHDLYVHPDGSLVWTVSEREVRSAADRPEERRREEDEYLDAVRADDHAVARALWHIGARRVVTRLVRDERPFIVVTSGEFDGIDTALSGLLSGLGVTHDTALVRADDGTLRLEIVLQDSADGEPDETVLALAAGVGEYRFVLTSGAFVEAEGFELESDATVARMIEPPASGTARYSLAWRPN